MVAAIPYFVCEDVYTPLEYLLPSPSPLTLYNYQSILNNMTLADKFVGMLHKS